MNLLSCQALVFGRVQGVGFRFLAQSEARRLGLVGSVRNLPDGSVAVVFEGTDAACRDFEAWLSFGPPGADVASVSVEKAEPSGASDFTIVR